MTSEQLEELKISFREYVKAFYGVSEYDDANIRLKDDHSRCVCEEILYLCDELGLDDSRRRLAEAIALLHDIGRFQQWRQYKTYKGVSP
ncbi:MAG: hypothetical protein ABIG61_01580 [Planctomycetota bacterium]